MRCDRNVIFPTEHRDNSLTKVKTTNLRGYTVLPEKNSQRADVVFTRSDGKNNYQIYAVWDKATGYSQWGAPTHILTDNIAEVERFYKNKRILQ